MQAFRPGITPGMQAFITIDRPAKSKQTEDHKFKQKKFNSIIKIVQWITADITEILAFILNSQKNDIIT